MFAQHKVNDLTVTLTVTLTHTHTHTHLLFHLSCHRLEGHKADCQSGRRLLFSAAKCLTDCSRLKADGCCASTHTYIHTHTHTHTHTHAHTRTHTHTGSEHLVTDGCLSYWSVVSCSRPQNCLIWRFFCSVDLWDCIDMLL